MTSPRLRSASAARGGPRLGGERQLCAGGFRVQRRNLRRDLDEDLRDAGVVVQEANQHAAGLEVAGPTRKLGCLVEHRPRNEDGRVTVNVLAARTRGSRQERFQGRRDERQGLRNRLDGEIGRRRACSAGVRCKGVDHIAERLAASQCALLDECCGRLFDAPAQVGRRDQT
jgi:hypothetical protein